MAEVAGLLGIQPGTIWGAIQRGKIETAEIYGVKTIDIDATRAYFAAARPGRPRKKEKKSGPGAT